MKLRQTAMDLSEAKECVLQIFPGIAVKDTWGETAFFYNPDGKLAHGTYFATWKEKDGANDKASHIDREGIYRLNFGISKSTFRDLFGEIPTRPAKGQTIQSVEDFTALDRITPHPVYGWLSWVTVLNPSPETFRNVLYYLNESYDLAVTRYKKQMQTK